MRKAGWMVAIPLTPVVIIGAALTAAIFGAPLGLPVLALSARPWWACLQVGLGRGRPERWSAALRVNLLLCLAVAAITFVTCALIGLDDLEDGTDAGTWAVLAAMVASASYGGARLLRTRDQVRP